MNPSVGQIIVGIDFGTTHSGASWAIGGTKDVNVIRSWPDPKGEVSNPPKVPSTISYVNGAPKNWGYAVKPDEKYFQWIKILLLQSNDNYASRAEQLEESKQMLRSLNLSASTVVRDYLKFFWAFVEQEIRKQESLYDTLEKRIILTVPAIWSPTAKELTRKAALEAGLPNNISLVNEPEAAAICTLDAKERKGRLEVGNTFIVVDAGGGTVDTSSYEVKGVKPLKVDRCTIDEGGLCGSIFLDEAFKKHIIMKIGSSKWKNLNTKWKRNTMRSWEGPKRTFTEDKPEYTVELRVEDDPANGIENEVITLEMTTIRALYDESATSTTALVDKQKKRLADKNLKPKTILLVGGFGSSPYLLHHLQKKYKLEGISVLQAEHAWSSVSRGATLWGLQNLMVEQAARAPTWQPFEPAPQAIVDSHIARYSIGVSCRQEWDPINGRPGDVIKDSDDRVAIADSQMQWLVRRGDRIGTSESFTYVFHQIFKNIHLWKVAVNTLFERRIKDHSLNIYYSIDDIPPTRRCESVYELCTVSYKVDTGKIWLHEDKVRNAQTNESQRKVPLVLVTVMNGSSLEFDIQYRGGKIGFISMSVDYKQ